MGRGPKKITSVATGAPAVRSLPTESAALHLRQSEMNREALLQRSLSSITEGDSITNHSKDIVRVIQELEKSFSEEEWSEIQEMINRIKEIESGLIAETDLWQAKDLQRAVLYNLLDYSLFYDDDEKIEAALGALCENLSASGVSSDETNSLDLDQIRKSLSLSYDNAKDLRARDALALYRWEQAKKEIAKKGSKTREAFAHFAADFTRIDRKRFSLDDVGQKFLNGEVDIAHLASLAEGVCVAENHPDFDILEDIYYREREEFLRQSAIGDKVSESPFLLVPDSRWALVGGYSMNYTPSYASNIDVSEKGSFVNILAVDTLHNDGLTERYLSGDQHAKELLSTIFVHEMIHDNQFRHFELLRSIGLERNPEEAMEATNRLEGLTQALTWAVRGRNRPAPLDVGEDGALAIVSILRECGVPENAQADILRKLNQIPFYEAFREMDSMLKAAGSLKTSEEIWISSTQTSDFPGRAISAEGIAFAEKVVESS